MGDFPMTFLSKSRNPRKQVSRRERRHKSTQASISVRSISTQPQQLVYVDRVIDSSRPVFPDLVPTTPSSNVVTKIYTKPLIFWFGKDHNNLFSNGASYGFDCRWFEGLDLSSLQHAKCLVVSCADTADRLFNIINFACEHGIPSVWFNRSLPPEVCYWSFDRRIHIDDTAFFWRDICRLVE